MFIEPNKAKKSKMDFVSKANSCNFRDFFVAKLSVPGISEPNVPLKNTGESGKWTHFDFMLR
jgi:hypothetical protein